ncbi:MAG TPA: hypothetical protein VFT55_12425 [Planctomycetota bacterium]|nr:hypothetical protein [Planctomycetota bacterium]
MTTLSRSVRRLFPSLLLAHAVLAQASAAPVCYELRIADRDERLAEVRATFPTAGKDTLELFLPVWSPGFYRVLNHHQHVRSFAAAAGGKALDVTQPTPNRWRVSTGGDAATTVTYTLHCARASVTDNQITGTFAAFCGPATFVGEVGAGPRPHMVAVALPPDWPSVATGLPPQGGTAHTFVAKDYDWLLDSPLVLGTVTTTPFDVLGARHEWVAFGDVGDWNTPVLLQRLPAICSELCATFGDVPFQRYVFLAGFRNANGGLEHLDSTLVSVSRRQLPDDAGFLSFLAHEYAHAFNVKRLRPVELGPFDYEQPPNTPSLWISEGLTTWFGDLALVRSGAVSTERWLALVSGHVRNLQHAAGRKQQTLADASLAVWKQSTSGVGGDPRTTVSYYVKGPVVGFVLEARLRVASGGAHGLDELMHRAYARYAGATGFTPEQFEALASDVAGGDQRAFFDRALRSTDELDYGEAMAWFGLEWAPTADDAPKAERWRLRERADATPEQQAHLRTLLARTPVRR